MRNYDLEFLKRFSMVIGLLALVTLGLILLAHHLHGQLPPEISPTAVRRTAERIHPAGALQLAPADPRPRQRRRHRAQHHRIHELPVDEALGEQQVPRIGLAARLKPIGDPAADEIDEREDQPVDTHPQHVGMGLGPAMLMHADDRAGDADHQREIDQRRDHREEDLEQPRLRQADQREAGGLALAMWRIAYRRPG